VLPCAAADDLTVHPQFSQSLADMLKVELALFKEAACIDVPGAKEFDHLAYHFDNKGDRPIMWYAAQIAALSQPSSAAAERVFSRYRHLFGPEQKTTLMDVKRHAVMLAVHQRVATRTEAKRRKLNID
jgi:hypothetical protein